MNYHLSHQKLSSSGLASTAGAGNKRITLKWQMVIIKYDILHLAFVNEAHSWAQKPGHRREIQPQWIFHGSHLILQAKLLTQMSALDPKIIGWYWSRNSWWKLYYFEVLLQIWSILIVSKLQLIWLATSGNKYAILKCRVSIF